MMPAGQYISKNKYAITHGRIATTHKGKRIIREYQSGEKLVGEIQESDAPPFTGFVRGWFGEGKK